MELSSATTPALDAPVKIAVRGLTVHYGTTLRAERRLAGHPGASRDGADRPVRLRQVDVPALPEPHERSHPRHAHRRQHHHRRREPLRRRRRPRRAAASRRHGVPEVQPVPEVDLRERRVRASHPRRARPGGAARGRRAEPPAGGAVGRGEGPARLLRARPLGRTAAASVHRARARRRARGAADGRAGVRARPDRHRQDRGADPGAQAGAIQSSS